MCPRCKGTMYRDQSDLACLDCGYREVEVASDDVTAKQEVWPPQASLASIQQHTRPKRMRA